jgi:hypothetical protein
MRANWVTRAELRAASIVVLTMAALGAALGPIWHWWSPAGPLGFVIAPHAIQVDESESFAAVDGRFAVLTGAVGLAAGFIVWFLRRIRGPVAAAALALGGAAGALLTELIGRLLDDGTKSAPVNTVIRHLPLEVHATALRLLEPLLALLVYSVFTAFAADDELGRGRPAAPLIGMGDEPQYGLRDRDAAGAVYQPEFPPQ